MIGGVATTRIDPLGVLSKSLQRLVKDIGATPKPRAVHRLRTTIRRFETRVADRDDESSTRAERTIRKQLDRIRQCAGKVRDTDVHLQALRSLPGALRADEYERVLIFLEKARSKRQKRLLRTLAAERERGLVKRLRQVVGDAAVGRVEGEADRDRRLMLVLERFDDALQTAAPLCAGTLHEFRIHTKRLRYLAETATPSAAATTVVAQLKRVQDAIGAWHDWLTLASRAAKALAGDASSPLCAAIASRTQARLDKALQVTASVGRRLQTLRLVGSRKGTRSVTAVRLAVPPQSAGASA